MLRHKKQSMILGFAIDPDLVCRRYENRAWRGVFGVKQWSYKLETNIKQNALLPFILKDKGFKANSCIMVNNAIFVILPVKGMAKKWAWPVPLFPE